LFGWQSKTGHPGNFINSVTYEEDEMNLAKMKVGTRLGLGFALVLLFLVAVTAVGILRMSQIQNRLDHVISVNNVVSRLVVDMRNNVGDRINFAARTDHDCRPGDMEPEMNRIKELAGNTRMHRTS
jgi:methyl-accepting chemotaxis protein